MKACLVTTSFRGIDRVRFLLKSLLRNDPKAVLGLPIVVTEDYSGDRRVSEDFDLLKEDFPNLDLHVYHLKEWGNIQGAAQYGFMSAAVQYDPEWFVFLSDDTAVSPNALTNMLTFLENDLKTVGLVQFPYWNSQDFCSEGDAKGEWGHEPRLLTTRHDPVNGFYSNLDWIDKVHRNPHWEAIDESGFRTVTGFDMGEPTPTSTIQMLHDSVISGNAFPYVSVHGTGFAVHAETFRKVGGFYEDTWRFDEGISYKVWTQSDRGVVALPGPPIVHYGGATAALSDGVPYSEAGTPAMWIEASGVSVAKADKQMREQMHMKGEKMCAELRAAKYWRESE